MISTDGPSAVTDRTGEQHERNCWTRARAGSSRQSGDLTDDDSLKNEGKVDETSGKVKDAANDAVDKVKDALTKD